VTRALACLPLHDQGNLLGVLLASASAPEALALEKMHLLSLLAEQPR